MGQAGTAICRGCGHGFWLSMGRGFESQVVFCEECGHGESIFHNRKLLGDGDPSARVGTYSRCSFVPQLISETTSKSISFSVAYCTMST